MKKIILQLLIILFLAISNPAIAATKLLVHYNGNDAATIHTAATGQTVTFAGNSQLDTADKEFGTASLLLDGDGDYNTVPANANWNFGTGDFTLSSWYKADVVNGDDGLLNFNGDANNYIHVAIYNSKFYIEIKGTNDAAGWGAAGNTLNTGTWTHWALVRYGTTITLYVNGTSVATKAIAANVSYDMGAGTIEVGRYGGGAGNCFDGWIDEVYVSNMALWTAAFTVPTAEYSTYLSPIKTVNGLVTASVKSKNGLGVASVKSINGLQ